MSFPPDEHNIPDYLADTGPVQAVRDEPSTAGWRRGLGLVSLLAAAGLTLGTVVLLLLPADTPPTPNTPPQDSSTVQTPAVEVAAPTNTPQIEVIVADAAALPTLDAGAALSILSTPLAPSQPSAALQAVRNIYNPFTIIPERPRSEIEMYTVVSGDTITSIAERFGLAPESIVWANDRGIVGNLRPGQQLNILPVDGVYVTIQTERTIADLAAEYNVEPYVIIDSDYNQLFGRRPEDNLPSGMRVVIPGAQAEAISWTPIVERVPGAGGSAVGGKIAFAVGDPGSCGLVDNPGGSGGWVNPMTTSYTWMRGFTSYHTGIDLSAPEGTPVQAANGGSVIFAGWNSWGYGYTVVLAHGPFTTLYGHMSSINVGCGQYISPGQIVGAVGSTGNSSGPHLHFEIRYQDIPQDPTYTLAF